MELLYTYSNLHGVTSQKTAFRKVTEVRISSTALNTRAFLVRRLLPSFFELMVTQVVSNTRKTRLGNNTLNLHVVELLRKQEYVTACQIFVTSQTLNRFAVVRSAKSFVFYPLLPTFPPPIKTIFISVFLASPSPVACFPSALHPSTSDFPQYYMQIDFSRVAF